MEQAPEIAEFSLKEVALRPGHKARQAKTRTEFLTHINCLETLRNMIYGPGHMFVE